MLLELNLPILPIFLPIFIEFFLVFTYFYFLV